ncbi:MAG: type II toxin-antitoxin system prevent-host-death family antitoxin [Desulfuromonadaceae bacterium]|nr:type II toxin-antitoxin system prevent-host-death family antitoxin [Desulfuromonadaceae bacterium]
MLEVTVTTFRKHIPDYLGMVRRGEDISLTSRGKVIARLVPPADEQLSAKELLTALRGSCHIGDVITPLDEKWEANSADS